MIEVNLQKEQFEQGTDEWLIWRDTGCGSSDIKVIQGKSEYKTRWELWAEKLGIKSPDDLSRNPNVQRGNFFEPLVLETVAAKFGVEIDVFCATDKDYPWRKVSFDGVIRGLDVPVEIKCPSSTKGEDEVSDEEKENSRYWDLIENGENSKLFQEYEVQLQYQIGMLNAPYGYFAFYFSKINKLRIIKVARNESLIKEIFEAVDSFYLEHIKPGIAPEKDKERDYYEPTDAELLAWDTETLRLYDVLAEERELKKQLKALGVEKKEISDGLVGRAHGFKRLCLHALSVNAVKGRETFQYKDFLAEKGVEITDDDRNKHTKVGKTSYRMSVIKDPKLLEEVENSVISNQKKQLTKQLFGVDDVSDLDDALVDAMDNYYITD